MAVSWCHLLAAGHPQLALHDVGMLGLAAAVLLCSYPRGAAKLLAYEEGGLLEGLAAIRRECLVPCRAHDGVMLRSVDCACHCHQHKAAIPTGQHWCCPCALLQFVVCL